MAIKDTIQSDVTYASIIKRASALLAGKLSNSGIGIGQFRNVSHTITIGGEVKYTNRPSNKKVTLKAIESRIDNYKAPSNTQIQEDLTVFLRDAGLPVGNTTPTTDGLIAFLFALNFFLEKAIVKRTIKAENNEAAVTHLHYEAPKASEYNKLPHEFNTQNSITVDKISAIYNQLENTSLLSDNVRETRISVSSHNSSSSSSSCSSSCSSSSSSSSSSSCSSSSSSSSSLFIAYFNLH